MKEFTAACVQIGITPNQPQKNIEKCLDWLDKAVEEYQADLVVFPETVTTGFATGLSVDALWDLLDVAPGKLTAEIQEAAKRHAVHVVWPTYRRTDQGKAIRGYSSPTHQPSDRIDDTAAPLPHSVG